ncbi:MAG: type IV pili methyl-accepting chemotaxis transducer N-terminal domain-containing protein [Desulfobacula sp.]
MAIRYKLGLIVAGLSFIILSMFLITWYTTSAQKTDGLLINLGGRQRMLSQKMSKEIVLFVSATDAKEKEQLKASATRSMEVFDVTLSALIESGEVPLSLDPAGVKVRCPKSPEPAASQLAAVRTLWKDFAVHMNILKQTIRLSSRKWILPLPCSRPCLKKKSAGSFFFRRLGF